MIKDMVLVLCTAVLVEKRLVMIKEMGLVMVCQFSKHHKPRNPKEK